MNDLSQSGGTGTPAATDRGPPWALIAMGVVFVAGLAGLAYVKNAYAEAPLTQQFLSGARFWIAVSFYAFLCALLGSDLHRLVAQRRRRRAAP